MQVKNRSDIHANTTSLCESNPNSTAWPEGTTKASLPDDRKYDCVGTVLIFMGSAPSPIGDDPGSVLSHVEMGRLAMDYWIKTPGAILTCIYVGNSP